MKTTDVRYAKNGARVVIASRTLNAKDMNPSEMSYQELLKALINACDKEIASKHATKNA